MNARRRSVPLRSCVACRNKAAKRDLLRVVAGPDGVGFDASGKSSGRGAYLCRKCASAVGNLKRGRLEYALRVGIEDAQWDALVVDLMARTGSGGSEIIGLGGNPGSDITRGAYD